MYFQISRAPGIHPPPGGYTAQDEEAMEMIGKLSQDEKAYVFFEWILKKGVFGARGALCCRHVVWSLF